MTDDSLGSEALRFSNEVFKRYARLMPAEDLTLIILKGHLLVEEQMNKFIEASLGDAGEAFRKANFPFARRLEFARRLHIPKAGFPSAEATFASVWRGVTELNDLRTKIAHKPEVPDLENLCAAFVEKRRPSQMIDKAHDEPTRLAAAIGDIVAALAGYGFVRNWQRGKRGSAL